MRENFWINKKSSCQFLVLGSQFVSGYRMSVELEKAKALRAMHRGEILVLPNAWDVASARVIQQTGFGAIATTSAGIAFTMGYPDGQRISREEMLAVVGRIASAVKVPVTADVEAGYGDRRKMLHALRATYLRLAQSE